jgi:hypothetical protein
VQPGWTAGAVVLEMYERLVEVATLGPTFYTDFPTEVSPLTRAHRDDPRLAERWDLVAFGMELGTAYTELIDPVEQRRRLTAQSLLRRRATPEAMELDEDFLHALEYAMPPDRRPRHRRRPADHAADRRTILPRTVPFSLSSARPCTADFPAILTGCRSLCRTATSQRSAGVDAHPFPVSEQR